MNEPGGLTRQFENDFNTTDPVTTAKLQAASAAGSNWVVEDNSHLSISTDGTAPVGDTKCIDTTFPNGWGDGNNPVHFNCDLDGDTGRPSTRYFNLVFQVVGNGSGTFENQSVGTKFGFFGYGASAAGALNQSFLILRGTGSKAFSTSMPLEYWIQVPSDDPKARNVGSGDAVTVGTWYELEIVFVINSVGSANGEFHMWVNPIVAGSPVSTKTHQYTNVTYRDSTNNLPFRGWKWDPTWGGVSGDTKTRDDIIRFAQVYSSVA